MKLELTLFIDGKEKTFVAPFVNTRMLRRAMELAKSEEDLENFGVENLDSTIDYLVDLFGKQFTRDEFYDGMPAHLFQSTVERCMQAITSGMNESTEGLIEKNK